MVNQRTLTHAHQEALHSSLFVSYLYNYFKVSTDFGFPFREKTIKPCSPGLSGESVRIISLQPSVQCFIKGTFRCKNYILVNQGASFSSRWVNILIGKEVIEVKDELRCELVFLFFVCSLDVPSNQNILFEISSAVWSFLLGQHC